MMKWSSDVAVGSQSLNREHFFPGTPFKKIFIVAGNLDRTLNPSSQHDSFIQLVTWNTTLVKYHVQGTGGPSDGSVRPTFFSVGLAAR